MLIDRGVEIDNVRNLSSLDVNQKALLKSMDSTSYRLYWNKLIRGSRYKKFKKAWFNGEDTGCLTLEKVHFYYMEEVRRNGFKGLEKSRLILFYKNEVITKRSPLMGVLTGGHGELVGKSFRDFTEQETIDYYYATRNKLYQLYLGTGFDVKGERRDAWVERRRYIDDEGNDNSCCVYSLTEPYDGFLGGLYLTR